MPEHFTGNTDDPIVQDSPNPEDKESVIQHIEALKNVNMHVSVVMGESTIPVKSLLSLRRDSIVELDRNQTDDVDIYINNRLVGKGQIMAIDDEYAVRVTSILEPVRQDGSMERVLNE